MKRTPTLLDLHQQDPSVPLVQPPAFPQPWNQPADGVLLIMADAFPLAVALQPYVGTGMVGNTFSVDRRVICRVAGSTNYMRVDAGNYFAPFFSGTFSPPADTNVTGNTDGVTAALQKTGGGTVGIAQQIWPTTNEGTNVIYTGSDAIIDSPSADQDRQIEVTLQKAPQAEYFDVDNAQSVTIWAGARTNDLTTL